MCPEDTDSRECFVLDATREPGDGLHCFVPIRYAPDGSVESIVIGLNYLSPDPPERGRFVGIIHEDGQEACDAWVEANTDEYERLRAFAEPRP